MTDPKNTPLLRNLEDEWLARHQHRMIGAEFTYITAEGVELTRTYFLEPDDELTLGNGRMN